MVHAVSGSASPQLVAKADSAPAVTGDLAVQVLGRLTATRDGVELDLGGPRQRAVLGMLLIARGAIVSAERLVEWLWGERPPPSAHGALQAYISHLRRRLEPSRTARSRASLIVGEGGGYSCRIPDEAVDAWRFERLVLAATRAPEGPDVIGDLEEALALWHGPPFAEYAGETWADGEAGRLSELRAVGRERLLAARLSVGESSALVPELEALAAEDPLREERWRLLALALYRSQRQADALAALRRARTVLADDLGVDPGPALRALEAEILAHSPALDAPARQVSRDDQRPTVHPIAAPPDDLVDRDEELAELGSCIADALGGHGRVALMEGPPGIGKTRLLTEARRLAGERGALTLTARGSPLEKEFGFGAVRQLFEPLLVGSPRREHLLAGAASSATGVFDVAAVAEPDRADGSFAVLHGLYWLTVNLAEEQPLVLAIDDLQWCDTGSLRFLAYLVRRLEGLPVLVAATLRTGEQHDDAALIAEVAHDYSTVAVRPGPLTIDGVADLVRHHLGDQADDLFVAACHRTTGGNPLLLRQLLRGLESEGVRPVAARADTVTAIGSRAVAGIVLMRLNRLPTTATAVARGIAVLGDGAALPTVAALAELDEQEAAAAIAALARAELVRDELPLGFVHPLVRDAVYRAVPPGERELYHERAARVLAAGGAAAEQIAAHLLQVPGRGDSWVVEVLRRAAATAADRGAADSAATYLARALAEPPAAGDRPQVLLELGRVEALGDGPAAARHLREAYETIEDARERASVAPLLAQTLLFAGERGEATAFAREAAAALDAELDDERQGLLALERISGYMHGLDEAVWRRGDVEVSGDGSGARMLAAEQAWERVIDANDIEGCIALARFALEGDVLLRVDPGLFWVIAAFVLEMANQDIGTFWDDALTTAYARGSLFTALSAHLWRGHSQWWHGDLRDAQQSLIASNEQSERWGAPAVGVPYGEAFLLEVLLDRGDVAGARSFLESVRARARMGDGARLVAEAEARLLIEERRFTEAVVLLESVQHAMSIVDNPVWRPWRSLQARALAGLGRGPEAVSLVEEELAVARRWGAPRPIGRALCLLGELRGSDGEADLREAVEVLAGTPARVEYARALYALGRVVPDRQEAVDMWRQALELAEVCGAEALRADVAAALTDLGVAVPEPAAGTAALTTTERRIAAMAADGADAFEIAQALFLTPGSVQVTLDTVRRLGDESGAQPRVPR